MPDIGGRHYMNPAYGRAMAVEQQDDARETTAHGDLKKISVHPQKDGSFSVHAHYQHPRAGHHSVESQHAGAEDAGEEVKRHLRGHQARRARRDRPADSAGENED